MFIRWAVVLIIFLGVGSLTAFVQAAFRHKAPEVAQDGVVAATATPQIAPAPAPVVDETPKSGEQARILMYHYIRKVDQNKDPLGYRLSVAPAEFEHQLITLKEMGYRSLTMRDLAEGKGGPRTVVLTFDDGYEDFYSVAWPLLQKHGFTATVYVISNMIGGQYMTWDQIRELHAAGIEIGAHTHNHRELNRLSEEAQQKEIQLSKEIIEREINAQVYSFCYPVGRYNDITLRLVEAAGFKNATTTAPGVAHFEDNLFTLKRIRINPGFAGVSFARLLR
jgi:peptidoglycan/xylan/chitin deacetylase (PgdA/CDA1 family)